MKVFGGVDPLMLTSRGPGGGEGGQEKDIMESTGRERSIVDVARGCLVQMS